MQIDLASIPVNPGIYLFKNEQGIILYVGKAKHLRKRVTSYFRGHSRHSPKTQAMLSHAFSLDTLSTNTEKEALLLEASLIKKHRPRYNIVLKDDKQYLLFYIDKSHPYPRLSIVRPRLDDEKGMKDVNWGYAESEVLSEKKLDEDAKQDAKRGSKKDSAKKQKGTFYGPFTSALAARETWRTIHRMFPLRRCTNRGFKNRVRPCLYYHLGQCLGPCCLPVSQADYAAILQNVEMFLNGRSSELIEKLEQQMLAASDNLNFEQAAKIRDQINAVKQTLEKQSAVMPGTGNLDAVGLAEIQVKAKSTPVASRSGGLASTLIHAPSAPLAMSGDVHTVMSPATPPPAPVYAEQANPLELASPDTTSGITSGITTAAETTELEGQISGLGLGILFVRQGRVLGGKTFFWPGLTLAEGQEVITSFLLQFYETATLIPNRILLPWALTSNLDEASRQEEASALTPVLGPVPSPVLGPIAAPIAAPVQASVLAPIAAPVQASALGPDPAFDPAEDLSSESVEAEIDPLLLQEILSDRRGSPVFISSPRSSVEKRLVSMASTNAKEAVSNAKPLDLGEILAQRLGLPAPARRIEVVDVSHTSGQETRVGLVVFENGVALRDQFRAYIVKDENVAPGDDYGALAHWAERRIKSGPPWPDLLLVDGGRGQLAIVARALNEAGVSVCFPLASIAKARTEDGRTDRRAGNIADRIFLPGRTNALNLKPGSPELLFLQMMRDAAHDQAIGRHRKARNKAALAGELVRLSGVGPKTAKLLWDNFDSLAAMAAASEEKLASLPGIGKAKAKFLRQELKKFG